MGTPDYKDVQTPVGNPLRYARRVMIEILQSAFESEYLYTDTVGSRVVNPFLIKFQEDGETAEDSRLVIADGWTNELEQTDPRPMIIVNRGDFGFLRLSVGQGKSHGWPEYDLENKTKTETYADLTEMPLSLSCLARQELEAEELAWACALFIRMLHFELKEKSQLFKISLPRVGAPAIVKSDAQIDLVLTPVTFTVNQTMQWTVTRPVRLGKLVYQFFVAGEDEPFVEV